MGSTIFSWEVRPRSPRRPDAVPEVHAHGHQRLHRERGYRDFEAMQIASPHSILQRGNADSPMHAEIPIQRDKNVARAQTRAEVGAVFGSR